MKSQHNIYLSLGSNLGNKFDYLQEAIEAIFEKIGSIISISPVFQTPAKGFESADFLNCVLELETHMVAEKLLETILSIEQKMGRIRSVNNGYTARPIDIDILFFDDQLIRSENLTIPHPEIPNRNFILEPFKCIAPDFVHPELNKRMDLLWEETNDVDAIIEVPEPLKNPIEYLNISAFRYLAIEGNIGAGKTSLATKMAKDFNAKLILERFKENPFLPKFYKDPTRFAFPLEMSFLADRYQQLLDDLTQYDLFKENVIGDYDGYKSLIFAKITLQEEEYTLYKKLFYMMHKELPNPDLYIYLYQNTERLLENIKKRGRDFEQEIEASYLQKINEGYIEFIRSQASDKIKIIDISNLDFVNNREDYLSILKEIAS
ncbi:MAG: 2-amino-4-hydroxy-6-hydroxymethyldihydropteridine diphosphokinase [Flavobacteriaceae bacterium]|nr:2-amino-4-hydroxy-6-hydroxymethyldihydropteridine diphosphokinase [Flavobacteriaceae bacterium]